MSDSAAADRSLAWLLRLLGLVDLLALAASVGPREWIDAAHAALGLGTFPAEPIAGYLARSASAVYALHGATILFVSQDVARYRPLIRFLGWVAVFHGLMVVGIDLAEGMPQWWLLIEGPSFSATGVATLALSARAQAAASAFRADDGLQSRAAIGIEQRGS